jgi:NTP pyrophosphatase (non-canonical NTP hydrolase)
MDIMLTICDLQKKINAFSEARGWTESHNPRDIIMALSVEVAELMENYLWESFDFDQDNVQDEIADIFIYALIFCQSEGIDPEQAILQKMDKNALKHPRKCKPDASL